jgi:hypothetical protein
MAEPTLRELIDSTGRPRARPSQFPRPKTKPPGRSLRDAVKRRHARDRARARGIALADAEFGAALFPEILQSPIAKLGFDPSRTTFVPGTFSAAGAFIPNQPNALSRFVGKGQVPPEILEHMQRQRPDLGESDLVLRMEHSEPQKWTLIHEFAHRGFDIIRRRSDKPINFIFGGTRFREEDITRLIDYQVLNDPAAIKYFDDRGMSEEGIRATIQSQAYKTFISEALQAGISNE